MHSYFSSFKKSDGRFSRFLPKEFDIESIKSIGIVAYGKDFYADIDVAGLELYWSRSLKLGFLFSTKAETPSLNSLESVLTLCVSFS